MTRTAKIAAVLVVVALMAPSLAALPACWQLAFQQGDCPGHCPMGTLPMHTSLPTVENGSCCQVTSTSPVAPATLDRMLTVTSPLLPAVLPTATAPAVTATASTVSADSPPTSPPSRQALHCVFLI